MSEFKEPNAPKQTVVPGRPRKEVELFPVAEKNLGAGVATSPNVAGASGVTRLGTQISIFNPVTFDEALDIVTCLRGRAATTISLDKMKKGDAGRLVDFVSGASAALDGDFHKLTEQVYIFCPANIKIVAPVNAASAKSTSTTGGAFDFLLSAEAVSDKINSIGRKS